MKILIKSIGFAMLVAVIASCQPKDAETILADETQQQAIMEAIASDHEMSMKMMDVMMNNEHGKMMMRDNKEMMNMMMKNQGMMQNMMKENPEMMNNMMGMMMNASKGDSSRMMSMCKKMMGNEQMKHMMQGMMKDEGGMGKGMME